MAPPFSLRFFFLRRGREVHGGLSCEIVSDLCPNPLSHDWHVQPSCQRPNRLPPERCAFSSRRTRLLGRTQERIRLSSKPYKHTVRRKILQPKHPTVFPRVFHIGKTRGGTRTGERTSGAKAQISWAALAARLEVVPFRFASLLTRNSMAFRLDAR
jgi:hypothetical protein